MKKHKEKRFHDYNSPLIFIYMNFIDEHLKNKYYRSNFENKI